MKVLNILRGLPGSGKSHYAKMHWPGLTPARFAPKGWSPVCISGDHYFTDLEGNYDFDSSKLGEAHLDSQIRLIQALESGVEEIVIDNTHSRLWEFRLALELARVFGYEVRVISLFDWGLTDEELADRNVHSVGPEIIAKHRYRWETYPSETVVAPPRIC